MEIEKLATSAVINELSKTDRLSSFINSGDKEPCWDGNVYIHEDKARTKKNIKKVQIQVKGKTVSLRDAKRTISYSISFDDLNAYMMNGGTLFFVVYLDKNTGEAIQIYYSELLPIKIKKLFEVKKNKYSVKFRKFPSDNLQKTELLINYYENVQKQVSFAGKDIPTIDDLAKEGILESVSIHYTGIGNYNSYSIFPKLLDGKAITLYAKIKGSSTLIPIDYYDEITKIIMFNETSLPVSVNGKVYYINYKVCTTAEKIEIQIGSSVKLIFSNVDKVDSVVPVSINIDICGTLKQQIAAIEFVSAIIEYGEFNIGKYKITTNFTQEEIDKIESNDFSEVLSGYYKIKELMDLMNVKKDLDIEKCTQEDIDTLNLLIGTIINKLPVKENPGYPANVQKKTIANLTLAVVYIENPNGGYRVFDYFGNHFDVTWAPDDSGPQEVSQFFSMGTSDYLMLDNINLKMIVEDFKKVNPSSLHLELANNTMLNMLKAYDKKPNKDFLIAAEALCEWQNEYLEYIPKNITAVNRLQIKLRERKLNFNEKAELYSIIEHEEDERIKIGAFLLLDEQEKAKEMLKKLSCEEQDRFKDFPIYKFYNGVEDENNGQT